MSEPSDYITKNIVLDDETKAIVDQLVEDRHFGNQGFSLGIRTIIREWAEMRALFTEPQVIPQTLIGSKNSPSS